MKILKKLAKQILPEPLKKTITKKIALKNVLSFNKFGSRNFVKKFYVIKSIDIHWGILSTWLCTLPKVNFALENKLIPVIDFTNPENHPTMLIDKVDFNKLNIWDLYFLQPNVKYDLESIYKSRNVSFFNGNHPISYKHFSPDIINGNIPLSKDDYHVIKKLYNIMPLNTSIVNYAKDLQKTIFPKNEKILGISFRRAFERLHHFNSILTPNGTHIVRMTLDQLIVKTQELLDELQYKYFFFTTDDRESLTIMQEKFKDKILYTERPISHQFENNKPIPLDRPDLVTDEFWKRDRDVYLRNKEYLSDIYLLSQCDSILSCGGTADLFAYIIKDGNYENIIQPK